jgi:hypothetical protein
MSYFEEAFSTEISLLPLITIGYTSAYLQDPVLKRRWHSRTMANNTNTAWHNMPGLFKDNDHLQVQLKSWLLEVVEVNVTMQ